MAYVNKTTTSGKQVKVKDYKKRVRRNRRNRRIAFFMFLITLFVCFTLFAPVFNIKSVVCGGNSVVNTDLIISSSKIIVGKNTYRTSLKKAQEEISKIPYIDSVSIKRVFPNSVKISVTESVVAAYILYEQSYIYIDKKGKVLEANSSPPSVNVPIIENSELAGFDLGKSFTSNDVKKFDLIVSVLQEIINNSILEKVTLINAKASDKLSFIINNKFEVSVGDASNLHYKINFLALKAYENLGANAKGTLDVSSGKKAIYKETY